MEEDDSPLNELDMNIASSNDAEESGKNLTSSKITASEIQRQKIRASLAWSLIPTSKIEAGLSIFDASSALLSTIIGGGIVGVPFGMLLAGIPMGILFNIICAILCYTSVYLYMEAKKLANVPVKTLYEFGYVGIGKSSLYYIAFLSTVQTVGFVMIYFIVFGDIMASVVFQLF
jgi:hypothetical protein